MRRRAQARCSAARSAGSAVSDSTNTSNSFIAPVAASDSQVARRPAKTSTMSSLQIGITIAVRAAGSTGPLGDASAGAKRSPRHSAQTPIVAVAQPTPTQANSNVISAVIDHHNASCAPALAPTRSASAAPANATTSAISTRRRCCATACHAGATPPGPGQR